MAFIKNNGHHHGDWILHHLTFGLIEPFDIPCIQQMMHGTPFSALHFNAYAPTTLVAKCNGGIVGLTVGHKGYGDKSHVLMIQGTYLLHYLADPCHENEVQVAFINWAQENLGVTHYALDDDEEPKPICIRHILPQTSPEEAHEVADSDKGQQLAYEIS